jgi:hypothetical protein
MAFSVEDLEDKSRFRLFLTIPYNDLLRFVLDYLKKRSVLTSFFWFLCVIFMTAAVIIRVRISGYFPFSHIILHSFLGAIVLPIIIIPLHEFLHIIPFFLAGAKNIRVGMDLKQYLFYVSAHRYVATPKQFFIVALTPLLIISSATVAGLILIDGLWKWSLAFFLFAHTTMCAGDIALLNLYWINKERSIYTWDDVDKKEAYFYERLQ